MTGKTLKIQEILQDLENGLMRDDIRKKYGLTIKETSVLFKHPKLANKRAKKVVTLNIIDDEEPTPKELEEITREIEELDVEELEEIGEISEDMDLENKKESKEQLNWL